MQNDVLNNQIAPYQLTGRQCINLPTPAVFDDVRVYIFGYSEGD